MRDVEQNFSNLKLFLKEGKTEEALQLLEETPLADVAEFLADQPLPILMDCFLLLDRVKQASVLDYLHIKKQVDIYNALPIRVFADIFEKMHSDSRADFYLALPDDKQMQLLPYLSKAVRRDVIMLSRYPEEKAGGIMSTDFVVLHHEMTAEEALQKMRQDAPSKKMMYSLYVVDENMRLIGIIDLKDLILANPTIPISDIAHDKLVFADLYDDRESVAHQIQKYGLMAIPVLNKQEQLVGIVSYDDAIDIIQEEQTEDMERFMGIIPRHHRDDYLRTSSWQHFKQRVSWVSGLFLLCVLAELLLHNYKSVFEKWSFLALYITMISDTGGNVGSQAATMVIRAMALGEITLKHWLSIIYKEARVACMLSLTLFILCFSSVWGLTYIFPSGIVPAKTYIVAITIALAVSLQVITATLIGASLPLLIKRLGKDPALAASPAITTIVDISGLLIYLATAHQIFSRAL